MADSEKYFTKTVDGQLSVATVAQSGNIIPEESRPGEKYTTALVQTDDGPQLCVKTISQTGTLIEKEDMPGDKYTTALVDTANGTQLCVKTYEQGGGGGGGDFIGIPREVTESGVYSLPQTDYVFTLPANVETLGICSFYYGFCYQNHLTEAVFECNKIEEQALRQAFYYCNNLVTFRCTATEALGDSCFGVAFKYCSSFKNFLMPNLKKVHNGFIQAFEGNKSIEQFELPNLEEITGGYCFSNSFSGCTNLKTASFPKLKKFSGSSSDSSQFLNCFNACTSLTSVNLNSLEEIPKQKALQQTFKGCTSLTTLSFPSLKSTSFGSYTNQFNNMLQNVTGCTVHFPSNLQSVIGTWDDVTNGFGGTNTTVLFDLPATE